MGKKTTTLISALSGAALLLAGCSTSGGEESGAEPSSELPQIVIGSLLPQTGDLAALGKSTQEAVELAVEQANSTGIVDVSLEIQDSGTDPSVAQTAIQTLLGRGVQGVIGEVSSTVCLSVVDQAAQAEVPMIAPACTTPQLTEYDDGGFFFRTAASSAEQGNALANLIWEDGNESVSIIGINDNWGQPIVSTLVDAFENLGGEVETTIAYDPLGRTFAPEAQRLAATETDAIVLIGYEDTSAAIINDASQRGLLDRNWYMGDGFRSAEFPAKALPNDPAALYEWRGIGTGSPTGEANSKFDAAFEEKFGHAPGSFAEQAYDAAWIIILAAIKAEVSGQKTVDEFIAVTDQSAAPCFAEECISAVATGESVALQGTTGAIEFNENGDPIRPVYEVWQFTEDGIETVETIVIGE